MQISKWIASAGQNIQVVAFFAHFFFAAFVVLVCPWYVAAATLIIGFAAVKEFWFDAKYEKDPPQTFMDNLEDFLGYSLGALLSVVLIVIGY